MTRKEKMKIAAIQLRHGPDPKTNLQKALAFIEEAAAHKAEFIALPEMFLCQRWDKARKEGGTDMTPHDAIRQLQDKARRLRVYLLAGSFMESGRKESSGQRKIFNTSVLINPRGRCQAKYRKIHLFDANVKNTRIRESAFFASGTRTATTRVKSFHLGLSVCYDLRFPRLYAKYFTQGVDLVSVPSSFTYTTGVQHWEVLVRARAIENFCYVVAPNQCGTNHHNVPLYGNSLLVSPTGEVLARADSQQEEIIYALAQKKSVRKARQPFVRHSNG